MIRRTFFKALFAVAASCYCPAVLVDVCSDGPSGRGNATKWYVAVGKDDLLRSMVRLRDRLFAQAAVNMEYNIWNPNYAEEQRKRELAYWLNPRV